MSQPTELPMVFVVEDEDSFIEALDIGLRKFPVRAGSGSLGVRSMVDGVQLQHMRGDRG